MADGMMTQSDPFASLTGFSNLLGLFKNGTTTTQQSNTSTSTPNISAAGMQQMIEDILGGTQGLASVATGQKTAGLYGSSTNQLLTNDLLTRTAGELAKYQAGTTTTSNQTGSSTKRAPLNPLASIGTLLGITGAGSLLGPTIRTASKKLGLDDLGNNLNDAIFGNGAGTVIDNSAGLGVGTDVAADELGTAAGISNAADIVGATQITGLGAGAGAGSGAAGVSGAAAGNELGTVAAGDESAGLDLGAGALGATADAGASSAAVDAALAGTGEAATDVAGFTAVDAAAADTGAEVAGGSGFLDTLGTIFEAAATSWVICTELQSRNALDQELYQACAKKFIRLTHAKQRGYQLWAIPVTRWIRKHPSGLVAKFFAALAKSRCEYLLGKKGKWSLGYMSVILIEPICEFIGRRLKKEPDWRSLYREDIGEIIK